MQVVCATCQLSFDAPEGANGLVCPICRSPLRSQSAGGEAGATKVVKEWSGGDLEDLIAILSAPAVSARVEVLGPTGDAPIGEVHLLAGGVSDSIYGGKSTDDALDRLRADKPTRFRVEQRLPNPTDGNLSTPGPEAGTLDGRALAHLMRYCEDYVISCAIDVWRGNETARVEYKRGEISGVTVGGIDAPERLAEVMQWSSGNYRLVVPEFQLPAVAPKRAPAEKAAVPTPAASAQAARQGQGSATKTIFGMPVAEIAKARAAAEAAAKPAAEAPKPIEAPRPAPAVAQPAALRTSTPVPTPAAAAPASRTTPPGVSPTPAAAPMMAAGTSATKTIFGVPVPSAFEGFAPTQPAPAARPAEPAAPADARADDSAKTETSKVDKKTGARKVEVPAPAMAPPGAAAPGAAAKPAPAPAPLVAPLAEPSESQPTTQPGFDPRAGARKKAEPAPTAERARPAARAERPIWAYIGVGFAFGLVLLGIYQLYGFIAH